MKRDFEKYFAKLQTDYMKMTAQRQKVEEEYKKGLITEEQLINFSKYCDAIKVNYDRTHYMWLLLHKKPQFIEDLINKITTSKMMKELRQAEKDKADDKAVYSENEEALDNMNKFMENN